MTIWSLQVSTSIYGIPESKLSIVSQCPEVTRVQYNTVQAMEKFIGLEDRVCLPPCHRLLRPAEPSVRLSKYKYRQVCFGFIGTEVEFVLMPTAAEGCCLAKGSSLFLGY